MTMYVVLGDGEMPRKALTETLQDLWERESEGTYWFIIQAKAEPTATDKVLVDWLTKNEIYFETLSDGTDVDEIYEGTQQAHTAKRMGQKVVNLLKTQPEEDEGAAVLGLFVSDDPEAEEDRWLNDVIQAAFDADFKSYALNDGLVEVDMAADADAAEQEPEEAPAPTKAAAKKAPAKKAAAKPAPAEEEEVAPAAYTREYLEDRTLDELKVIATERGIELPPRTRAQTYVTKILGEDEETPEAEVSEVEEEEEELPVVEEADPFLSISSPAMLVVIYDGQVVSRVITAEEAEAILTGG